MLNRQTHERSLQSIDFNRIFLSLQVHRYYLIYLSNLSQNCFKNSRARKRFVLSSYYAFSLKQTIMSYNVNLEIFDRRCSVLKRRIKLAYYNSSFQYIYSIPPNPTRPQMFYTLWSQPVPKFSILWSRPSLLLSTETVKYIPSKVNQIKIVLKLCVFFSRSACNPVVSSGNIYASEKCRSVMCN